jgi:hypothetical protein
MLPVAVVIGADPGTIIASVTPVPDTLSEYQFAGLLRGRRLDLVDCKTVPLKVPAEAKDDANVTTAKEYKFIPSERLPEVTGTSAYTPLEKTGNTVKFAINVWAGWGPIISSS